MELLEFIWNNPLFTLVTALAVGWWWLHADHPHIDQVRHWLTIISKSAVLVRRWGRRSDRRRGTASLLDILRSGSGWAVWRRGKVVRPSLKALSWLHRLLLPAVDVGVRLARVGLVSVWASLEDVVVVFGGPRTGKSAWMAGPIIDFPFAAVVTTTRTDMNDNTVAHRAKLGPTWVFNPTRTVGMDSTMSFDPLTGCSDPVIAGYRATDMIGAVSHGGGGDRAYWEGQATRVLTMLLHAAALGNKHMRDVNRWVADPEKHHSELLRLLRKSPTPSLLDSLDQFVATNDKTRTSITNGVVPALNWLNDPAAAACGERGLFPLDVEELINARATLYMLGAEDAHTAPLVAALTGHIAREALRLAQGERLDPGLGLFLDEAANICPVPIEKWTSYFGGSGITMVLAFQSLAQVTKRWGKDAAAIILNNAATVMLFGGTKDSDDLAVWGKLAGEYEDWSTPRGGGKPQRVMRPVLTAPQLSNLPMWRVAIFRRPLRPCIGRIQPVWKRADVRWADGLPGTGVCRALVARCRALRALTRRTPDVGWVSAPELNDAEITPVDWDDELNKLTGTKD